MSDEAKAARNAYRREWTQKNRDKTKHYLDKHRDKAKREAWEKYEANVSRGALIPTLGTGLTTADIRRRKRLEAWEGGKQ